MYLHCYAHTLNLAVQDTCKQVKIVRDALDVSEQIIKFVKRSPKREQWLEGLKDRIKYCDGEEVQDDTRAGKLKKYSSTR